jgi:hypothetical protein
VTRTRAARQVRQRHAYEGADEVGGGCRAALDEPCAGTPGGSAGEQPKTAARFGDPTSPLKPSIRPRSRHDADDMRSDALTSGGDCEALSGGNRSDLGPFVEWNGWSG